MSLKVDRRGFLQFTAGGALGAATSGLSLRGLSELTAALSEDTVRVPSGPEKHTPGLCSLCPAACGVRVRTIAGRAVQIGGNPLHPVNQGRLCPKGIAGLQALYHPDRLRVPLRNVGSRTMPRWREVSWDEAMGTIIEHLSALRAAGEAHTVALIDRPQRSLRSRLLREFMAAYGSPNYSTMPSGMDALQAAVFLQQGISKPVAFDLERTQYLLSFGVDLLEGWGSPVTVMRAFGRWRDAASGRRTKFVQIEPRFSITAARADEWVPLRPGTEAALALGIAYVLITEGLYDARFVREQTFGFEDWTDTSGKSHMGFRSLVLSEYRLNTAAEITGVPAETILRLGREIGRNRPAIAIGDQQTTTLTGNPYAAMAVHSLNALVGSIDVPGGVLAQSELPWDNHSQSGDGKWPRVDATAEHPYPTHHLIHLAEAALSGKPYPVKALLVHEVNPVFALPDGDQMKRALQAVPFVVAWTTFMDETAAVADIVLPAATGLETWRDAGPPPTFPNALQAIAPPVVEPRQGRDPADTLLAMAKALGGRVSEALPFSTFEEYLRRQADAIFAAQTGAVFAPGLEQAWYRFLEPSGWWAPTYSTAEELWTQMKERGGWWEPSYSHGEWERVCQTPSRRFEFYSQALARRAKEQPHFARAVGLSLNDDHLCLPHQPPLPEAPAGYPLLLLPVEVLPFSGGEGAHLPYLQQIAGEHLFEHWDSWLEVNPETAHKLGIRDGDRVWVESRRGRVHARARLYQGVRAEVVHLPLGYGRTVGSEWACRGANPLSIADVQYEPVAGLPQTSATFVKVYRA